MIIKLLLIGTIGVFGSTNTSSSSKKTHKHHKVNHHKIHHKSHTSNKDHLSPPTRFDLCVANNETGSPGKTTFYTVHWHDTPAQNEGLYWGAYSWLQSTWESQGGLRYAYRASDATPREQTAIFETHWKEYQTQWPNTVPPCLKYR